MIATSNTVTERLTGYGEFSDLRPSILSALFGCMVRRAVPVVAEYHSDLFHDVTWLSENVTGPNTFDYMVRTSGTNIGESARIMLNIGAPGAVLYRVRVYNTDGLWFADFTVAPSDTGI